MAAGDADRRGQSFGFFYVRGQSGPIEYELDDALLGRLWLGALARTLSRVLWWHVFGLPEPGIVWCIDEPMPMRTVAWQGVRGPDGRFVTRDDPEMAAALDRAAQEEHE